MKKVKLFLYVATPLMCGSTGLFGLYCYIARSMQTMPVLFSFDTLFSEKQKNMYTRMYTDRIRNKGPQVAVTAPDAAIASLFCSYRPSGHVYIDVRAHIPCAVVNHTKILTDSGALVPCDAYAEEIIQTLPAVMVPASCMQKDTLPEHMYTAFINLDDTMLFDYYVSWHNEHALVLKPKNNKNISFICDPSSGLVEKDMLTACYKAAKIYVKEKRILKKLIVDTRFADQIIVYGDTGGYSHGAGTG